MDALEYLHSLVQANEGGCRLIESVAQFDAAADHIVGLIGDSFALYSAGRFATSAFLSITAIEEIAKVHVGSFSDGAHRDDEQKNAFRSHQSKLHLAAMPTVAMGSRLNEALGGGEVDRLINSMQKGRLVKKREAALYFEKRGESIIFPSDRISKDDARGLLLLAVEIFDDALVGSTNHSFELSEHTDEIFSTVTNDIL
ncbi:MAG: AbiV family abortive infection protein [Pseudomonadales bacterium]|nr:AbiV family abortive infection protein [Pseudomonadales bacterium]